MSIIEDRVVRASFDNSGFDSKVAESTRSIEKFEQAVTGKDYSSAFNPLLTALGSVQEGFSKFELVAVGVMTNIATKAVEAGQQLLKSFTIDPITQGFSKYETYTDSIQTVMAATGKSMEEIEGYMEKLSWFSDETSYSLTDMTSNIGKFTAAGVDLDKSVTAMIGISNLAAISGQRSAEAARVMYNASQALGQGYMAAIDWKSIENANMATMEFKQILIDTALAMGTIQKAGEGLEDTYIAVGVEAKDLEKHYFNATSMRNNLSDKWLTGDVFVTALENYGKFSEKVYDLYTEMNDTLGHDKLTTEILDDIQEWASKSDDELKQLGYSSETAIKLFRELSDEVGSLGNRAFLTAQETKTFTDMVDALKDATSTAWSKVYEAIFGNYVEAKEFWSELVEQLYDLAVVPVQGIVSRLKEWKAIGGRDDLLDGIKNSLQVVQNLVDHITEGFRSIFPQKTKEQLKAATEKFKNFTEKLVDLTSVLEKVKEPIEDIAEKAEDAVESVEEKLEPIAEAVGTIGDAIEEAVDNLDAEKVSRGIDKIMTGFKGLLTVVKMAFDMVGGIFKMVSGDAIAVGGGVFGKILDWVEKAGQWLIDLRQELIDTGDYGAIFKVFSDLYNEVKRVFTDIKLFILRVWNDIFGDRTDEFVDRFGKVHDVLVLLYSVVGDLTDKLRNFKPFEFLEGFYSKIDITKVSEGLAKIKSTLSSFREILSGKIKEEVPKILNVIASAHDKLWASINNVDWQKVISDKVAGATRVLNKFKDALKRANFSGMLNSILDFGVRLFNAGKTFAATFDFSDIIVKGVDIVTGAFTQARKIIDKVDISKLVSNTTNIISYAFEHLRKIITKVDFSGLVSKGIGVLNSVTGQIKSFMKRADFTGFAKGVVSVLSGMGTQIKKILDRTDFAGLASSALSLLSKGISQFGNLLKNVDLSGVISKGVSIVTKVISKLSDALGKVDLASVANKILYFVEVVLDVIDKLVDKLDFGKIIESVGEKFEKLGKFIEAAQQGFNVEGYEGIRNFFGFAKSALKWIGDFLGALKKNETLTRIFNAGTEAIIEFGKVVADAFTLVRPFFDGLLGNEKGSYGKKESSNSGPFGWVGDVTDFIVEKLEKLKEFLSNLNLTQYQDKAYEFGGKLRETAFKIWDVIQWLYEKITWAITKVQELGIIDWVKEKLEQAPAFFEEAASKIKIAFDKIKTAIDNSGIKDSFAKLFTVIFGDEKDATGTAEGKLTILDHVFSILSFAISKIADLLALASKFFDTMTATFDELGGGGSSKKSRMTVYNGMMNTLAMTGSFIQAALHIVFSIVMNILKELKENPLEAINMAISIFCKIQWARLLGGFVSIFYGVGHFFKGIGDAGIGIRERIGESWADKIAILIQCVAVIAASIILLGKLPEDEMKRGIIATSVIAGVLIAIAGIISLIDYLKEKFGKSVKSADGEEGGFLSNLLDGAKNFIGNISKVLLLVIGMVALSKVIQTIGGLVDVWTDKLGRKHFDVTRLVASILAMGVLISAMASAMLLLSKADLAGKDFKKGLAILLTVKTIAAAMKSVGDVMVKLKNARLSPEEIAVYGLALVAGLMSIAGVISLIDAVYSWTHTKPNDLLSMAAMVIVMCGALLAIAFAVNEVSKGFGRCNDVERTWDALKILLVSLAGITLLVAAITIVISKFVESGKVAEIVTGVLAIVAMSAAMVLIAKALNMAAESIDACHGDGGTHWQAMANLLIPLALMGAIVVAVGALVKTWQGVVSIALLGFAMVIMSACTGFIAFALTSMVVIMDNYYIDDIWEISKSLALTIGIIGAFIILVGKLVNSVEGIFSMLAASVAFGIISVSVLIIAAAIAGLAYVYDQMESNGLDFDNLINKLQSLILAIGIITFAIGLITAIPTVGGWAALTFVALGAMFVIFAAAVYIVAKAATVFADAVTTVVDAIKKFSEIENYMKIGDKIVQLLTDLGTAGSYLGKHIISIVAGVIALKLLVPALSSLSGVMSEFSGLNSNLFTDLANGLLQIGAAAKAFGNDFFVIIVGALAMKVVAKVCESTVSALSGFIDIMDKLANVTPTDIQAAYVKMQASLFLVISMASKQTFLVCSLMRPKSPETTTLPPVFMM